MALQAQQILMFDESFPNQSDDGRLLVGDVTC